MKTLQTLLVAAAVCLSTVATYAQNFLSTEAAENLLSLGVRVGVNTSNRTFSNNYFQQWNVNSWGTGVDAGVVFDLNMRDFFTLQPGFFFESRSGNYAYAQNYFEAGESKKFTEMGHYRTYNFTVPLMLSFRFNITESLRWAVEAGPYAQFQLHSSDDDKITVIEPQTSPTDRLHSTTADSNTFDFGAKLGTGLIINRKYSFNVHYLAGFKNAWGDPHSGGRNKAWTFTLGYDF